MSAGDNGEGRDERGRPVEALDTPCLVVDLDLVERNIIAMAERVAASGCALRPHVKTHKTPILAHQQILAGASGITVAKLGEAEIFAAAGCDDILLAYQVIGADKVSRLISLCRSVRLQSCVDNLGTAQALSRAAADAGVQLELLLDVDTGLGRTGCLPEQAVALGLRIASLPGLALNGVFTFAGYPSENPDPASRKAWAHREATAATDIAAELRDKGVPATTVSVAGTCCAAFALEVPGVTEVRPGTYIFGDANYARLGAHPWDACALTVRASVVSRPTPKRAVLDSGTKVLAADRSRVLPTPQFGHLVDRPESRITHVWEEHAVAELANDDTDLCVGDVVTIIPNHACVVMNLADRWYGVRRGIVEEIHAVAARGRVQ
jgi:D-serine deaminase-like pyridoxal phosphate-dependent protein